MRSATSSVARRSRDAAPAGREDRRATGSSPRRSCIGRAAPAIRSCTRTSSSPTSSRAADGRWSALDGRLRLRARADRRLSLPGRAPRTSSTASSACAGGRCARASAEIDGVPARVLRAFSRRRAEIEAALERHGSTGRDAAQIAALATRRAKDRDVAPSSSRRSGATRAARSGLDAAGSRGSCPRRRSVEAPESEPAVSRHSPGRKA